MCVLAAIACLVTTAHANAATSLEVISPAGGATIDVCGPEIRARMDGEGLACHSMELLVDGEAETQDGMDADADTANADGEVGPPPPTPRVRRRAGHPALLGRRGPAAKAPQPARPRSSVNELSGG